MIFSAFLYRRLAQFVTCEILLPGGKVSLSSKHHVNSFRDVFCHPFYWQLYSMLDHEPVSIVDCGGHLGHFCILAEQCVKTKFERSLAHYTVVEPNPVLIKMLKRNLEIAGIDKKCSIFQGMLGEKTRGEGELWTHDSNLLSSSCNRKIGHQVRRVPWVSLEEIAPKSSIDVLKIDIEGAEYELVPTIQALLKRTRILLIELHANDLSKTKQIKMEFANAGLKQFGDEIMHGEHRLVAYKQRS